MVGSTNKVKNTALSMPPTIGAAIRLITSEPVPVPYKMGNKPTIIAAAVIITGLMRIPAPSKIASFKLVLSGLILFLGNQLITADKSGSDKPT